MAQLVSDNFQIITPSPSMISLWKQPAPMNLLLPWFQAQIETCISQNTTCHVLISSELLFYGGLINSRISNETESVITSRIDSIMQYKLKYGDLLKFYVSNVIMRIPSYNGDFEEPWYWAFYGQSLFQWSFYLDRYHVLQQQPDLDKANQISKSIPPAILNEFVWRRERNHNVTRQLLQKYGQLIEKIWITLDDNAEYGFNKAEERDLRNLIQQIQLQDKINLYPGADEVSLTMLSNIVVSDTSSRTKLRNRIAIFYRDSSTKNYIPNYEGQPLNVSMLSQIQAAGGVVVYNDDWKQFDPSSVDILLLVNNWSTKQQQEAPNPQTAADYSIFQPLISKNKNKIFIFADVRFSNGGDLFFTKWLLENRDLTPSLYGRYTYAGWNTNGNTLGTCISNGVILSLFQDNTNSITANQVFQLYRFAEDVKYQAELRQLLYTYVTNVAIYDSPQHLDIDLQFYSRFVQKGLQAYVTQIQNDALHWSRLYVLDQLYYPWNRTFEIGFSLRSSTRW